MVKTLEVFMRTLVRDPDRLFSLINFTVLKYSAYAGLRGVSGVWCEEDDTVN